MRFLRRYSAPLLFVAVLIFCSVKVIEQFQVNQSRHVELREDFMVLYSKGHTEQAEHFLESLIFQMPDQTDAALRADLDRAKSLATTNQLAPNDPLARYRFALRTHLDKRDEKRLEHLLKDH